MKTDLRHIATSSSVRRQVAEAAETIQTRWRRRPRVGVILGTGLGRLVEQIEPEAQLSYETIPHFPRATALSHKGRLCCGRLRGVPVVAMEGRFHAYEGYSLAQTTFPVRVMRRLGIELLIVSNAAGGMNPRYRTGDIMVVEDHINLMRERRVESGESRAKPRWRDEHHAPARLDSPLAQAESPATSATRAGRLYDPELIERALEVARRENFVAHRGTYVAVTGPNYETRAEYRFLRRIGGDVVGMSTAPEALVAARLALRVLALSTVTNVCLPDDLNPTSGENVVAAAQRAEANVRRIVREIVADEAKK